MSISKPKTIVIEFSKLLSLADRLSFFDTMKSHEITRVLRQLNGDIFVYEKDDFIIEEGEKDCDFFIILSGKVSVIKGKESYGSVGTIKAGDFFGEISFIVNTPRLATILASERTIVLRLNETNFSSLEPAIQLKVKDKILQKLVSRLHLMNKMVLKLKP